MMDSPYTAACMSSLEGALPLGGSALPSDGQALYVLPGVRQLHEGCEGKVLVEVVGLVARQTLGRVRVLSQLHWVG